jgi:hypothetical protein
MTAFVEIRVYWDTRKAKMVLMKKGLRKDWREGIEIWRREREWNGGKERYLDLLGVRDRIGAKSRMDDGKWDWSGECQIRRDDGVWRGGWHIETTRSPRRWDKNLDGHFRMPLSELEQPSSFCRLKSKRNKKPMETAVCHQPVGRNRCLPSSYPTIIRQINLKHVTSRFECFTSVYTLKSEVKCFRFLN